MEQGTRVHEVQVETPVVIHIHSPDKGRYVGSVPVHSVSEVDAMITEAREAHRFWAAQPVQLRAQLLHRWADKLERMEHDLAEMITDEVGKPLSASHSEVQRTVELIHYTAEEGIRIHGEFLKGDSFPGGTAKKLAIVEKTPVGVVLAISPFNYPVNLSAAKIAPALAAGNAVVFKPATQGALSGISTVQALVEAGMPKGLVQTVTGKGSEIGSALVTHPGIDMISFTGGTSTGNAIAKQARKIPLVMELGGKDPAIVLEDADLDMAAKQIVSGAFSFSGQRCTAIKRIIVIDSVADALVKRLRNHMEGLTVGSARENCVVVPLINKQAADHVEGLIEDARVKGADIVTGGHRVDHLIYPTLLDRVTREMRVAWEEQFGPVLPVMRVGSVEEAVQLANASEYGLQASVFTNRVQDAFAVASQLQVGTVQLNGRTERGPDHFPFLGVKQSGLGVQGIRRSIESMMRDRVFVLNL